MDLRGRAFQVVSQNAAVELRRTSAEFSDCSGTSERAPKIGAKTAHRCIDVLGFFDPRRREAIHAEQMMGHPQAGIGVDIQLDGFAFAREVFELPGFDRLPYFALRDGFPLVQSSVCHKRR